MEEGLTIPWSKGTIGLTMIYKTLHRKLKIEQHNPYRNPEGEENPAQLVAPVMLLLF